MADQMAENWAVSKAAYLADQTVDNWDAPMVVTRAAKKAAHLAEY